MSFDLFFGESARDNHEVTSDGNTIRLCGLSLVSWMFKGDGNKGDVYTLSLGDADLSPAVEPCEEALGDGTVRLGRFGLSDATNFSTFSERAVLSVSFLDDLPS